MQTATLLLMLVVLACAVGMAIFGVLWFNGREARLVAERASDDHLAKVRAVQASELQCASRLKKAMEALDALRASSADERQRLTGLLDQCTNRYARIAHWEGVENIAIRERELKESVAVLERAVEALRNIIDGYGSRYVVPPQSILDELAREVGYSEPGQRLKEARDRSRQMVRDRKAATCDYADGARAQLGADFALDAFNGKIEAILSTVRSDNIGTLLQKIDDAYTLVNEQGVAFRNARITKAYLDARVLELKWAVKAQQIKMEAKEEQRRLKEQIREEAKSQREFERVQRESRKREEAIAHERSLIEQAQAKAEREQRERYQTLLQEELARATQADRARIEAEFKVKMFEQSAAQRAEFESKLADSDARLAEALAAGERAKSMAQQTKRGTVYVISNVGAFGETVFKIGQTRRLNPQERIDELGDASVPFEFDVHALITTDDAPGLEGVLHERFVLAQVNKMNWRKEFFRIDLVEIRKAVEDMGLQFDWTMTASAQQFRETQALEVQLNSDPLFRERWICEQRGVEFDSRAVAAVSDDSDEDA